MTSASIPKAQRDTQLLVNDGETAVIGGLTQTQVSQEQVGHPAAPDLPLIGRLFSQTDTREEKRDLLILITPHIIDEGEAVRPPTTSANHPRSPAMTDEVFQASRGPLWAALAHDRRPRERAGHRTSLERSGDRVIPAVSITVKGVESSRGRRYGNFGATAVTVKAQ